MTAIEIITNLQPHYINPVRLHVFDKLKYVGVCFSDEDDNLKSRG